MKPKRNEASRGQQFRNVQGEGPNWILIAGGALLSTLSLRLGYKLKQALETRQQSNSSNSVKGKPATERRRSPGLRLQSNIYSYAQADDFNCISGNDGVVEVNHPPNGQTLSASDVALPLVAITPEFNKENGVTWPNLPECLELPPPKPFHHSNCSDSPCVSESGSDIFSKREVIQKLRQQLKRRDDMVLDMQDQIIELQNSLNSQLETSVRLQSQLELANGDLFDSEREIQRLRKTIAAHCMDHTNLNEKPSNGHVNGFLDGDSNFGSLKKVKGDSEKIEMLKREIGELKELLEGKEYLLQSYKEQKSEMSVKMLELQQRLDSQLPNIL